MSDGSAARPQERMIQMIISGEDVGVVGEDLSITVEVVNSASTQTAPDSYLHIEATEYWGDSYVEIGSVPGRLSTKVTMLLRKTALASIDTLPSRFTVALHAGGRLLKTQGGVFSFSGFRGGLKLFDKPPGADTLNILMLGQAGVGKSCFLSSCLTMMSKDQFVKHGLVKIGGTSMHITTKITQFPSDLAPAAFIDTFGASKEGIYDKTLMSFLLSGKLPNGFSIDQAKNLQDLIPTLVLGDEEKWRKHAIHAVVFLMKWQHLEDESEKKLNQDLFELVKLRGLNPIVVLTHVDELEPEIRTQPMKPGDLLLQRIAVAATHFGIGKADVLYTVNYTNEEKRVFDIDRLLYKNVHKILRSAEEFTKRPPEAH